GADVGAGVGAALGAGLGVGLGADCGGAVGVAAGAAFNAAPAAPSLICPRTAPTATVSPSLAAMLASTPPARAGTSIVTLSASSSTRRSLATTPSPPCL